MSLTADSIVQTACCSCSLSSWDAGLSSSLSCRSLATSHLSWSWLSFSTSCSSFQAKLLVLLQLALDGLLGARLVDQWAGQLVLDLREPRSDLPDALLQLPGGLHELVDLIGPALAQVVQPFPALLHVVGAGLDDLLGGHVGVFVAAAVHQLSAHSDQPVVLARLQAQFRLQLHLQLPQQFPGVQSRARLLAQALLQLVGPADEASLSGLEHRFDAQTLLQLVADGGQLMVQIAVLMPQQPHSLDLNDEVQQLQESLGQTETSIDFLPQQGFTQMLQALEIIDANLSAIDLNEEATMTPFKGRD
ncbi:hypothetical protein HUJ05_008551 [Dendroctonus ponderosae]|nr:hypothetical protein HUJ05_008551 [Dendroctonus ponderosae]